MSLQELCNSSTGTTVQKIGYCLQTSTMVWVHARAKVILLTHAQQFQVFCFHIPTRPRGSYTSRRNQRYKAQTNAYNRWLLAFVRFVHNLNQPSLPSPDKCFVARQQGLSQSKRHYGVAAIVDGTRMATLLAESYFSVLGALRRGLSGSQSPQNLQGSTHVND